jgi:hypothetical protein
VTSGFAEARRTNDHERLRELTFAVQRRLCGGGDEDGEPRATEVGPLPGYAWDDERKGRELVAVEDTLMFLQEDDEEHIVQMQVAVNLELDEVYRGTADPPVADPTRDKLGELFERVTEQVRVWQRYGRLRENHRVRGGVELVVGFMFRDQYWNFEWADGHFDSMGCGNMVDMSDEITAAEEALREMIK